MHVTVSTTFPAEIRATIEAWVRAGFEGVESGDVEAHVKARAKKKRAYVALYHHRGDPAPVPTRFPRRRDAEAAAKRYGGPVEVHSWAHPRAGGWSARSYDGVPSISSVTGGTRYLVTFNIPADPRRLTRYPEVHRDPRLKTSPVVTFHTWREQLFHIAAHEARHIHQFRHGVSRSELDAERWAASRLSALALKQQASVPARPPW